MKLSTATQVINFASQLEEESAKFYEKLAEQFPAGKDTFLFLAKDCRKNKLWIHRVYQEVVSDALETGFSFKDFTVDETAGQVDLTEDTDLPGLAEKMREVEEEVQQLYGEVASRSKSFLADVSRVFERIARRRKKRIEKIKSLA